MVQRVKQHQKFVKGSNNIRKLRNCTKGQTTSEVGYGVVQWVKQQECYLGYSRSVTRNGTKGQKHRKYGQTTSELQMVKEHICSGEVQRVKQHLRFVTECYKGSNNIRSLLGSGAKGQTTSDVCYGVV